MCWEHSAGLHGPPCYGHDDAGSIFLLLAYSGLAFLAASQILSTPCQVELLNCMSAASKPEEAGPECFAQFGVDWAPVQVICIYQHHWFWWF